MEAEILVPAKRDGCPRQDGIDSEKDWDERVIVCLPYFSGDAWLLKKNLEWYISLDVKVPYECVLSCDTKTDSSEVIPLAKQFFKKVHQFQYDRVKEDKWPFCQNHAFMSLCWYMYHNFPKQSWLWLETDVAVLCSKWIEQIEACHIQGKKPFTGHWNSETSVFNGVAVYPWDVCRHAPKAVTAALCEGQQPPWDVYCSKEVEPHLNKANHLFQHIWRDDTTGEAHVFKHAGDIDRIIRKGVVLFHRDKTGSIIDVMRHTPPCESRVEDLQKPAAMEILSSAPVVSKDRIDLSEVTLWSAVWTNDESLLEKTLRVLRYCSKLANFNRIVLFSCLPVPKSKWVEWIKIPMMDMEGWNLFVNRVVPLAIHSPFSMSVHEDGFILNPHLWKPEFLKYDYVGAPWKDGVVGNGGFCIESRKLSYAKTLLPFSVEQSKTAADMWLCRNSRAVLEAQGIQWAPRDLALEFSTETFGNNWPSFGYHGRQWSPEKYSHGWRKIEAAEK